MARLNTTFTNFVTVCVLAIHLVLLPALYFGVGYVIRKSHEELFVQHARTFARVVADEFEVGAAFDSPARRPTSSTSPSFTARPCMPN